MRLNSTPLSLYHLQKTKHDLARQNQISRSNVGGQTLLEIHFQKPTRLPVGVTVS